MGRSEMRVELPDGSILEDVPEGTSKRDIQDMLIRAGMGQRLVAKGVDLAAPETSPRPDTPQSKIGAEGLPDAAREVAQEGVVYGMTKGGLGNVLAGAGSKLNDWAMGLKQLAGQQLTPEEESTLKAARAFREGSTAARIGAGALPVALGWIAAPGMGIAGMAVEGGLLGAVEPTLGQESRAMNTGLGAGLGALTGGIARGITGKAGSEIIAKHPELVAGGKIPTYGELGVAGGKVGAGVVKKAEDMAKSLFASGMGPKEIFAALTQGSIPVSVATYVLHGMGLLPTVGQGLAALAPVGAAYLPAVRNVLTGASQSAAAKGLRAGAGAIARTSREAIRGILTRDEE